MVRQREESGKSTEFRRGEGRAVGISVRRW